MQDIFAKIADQVNATVMEHTDKAVKELLEAYALPSNVNELRSMGYMLHIKKDNIVVEDHVVKYKAVIELCRVVDTRGVALEINLQTK